MTEPICWSWSSHSLGHNCPCFPKIRQHSFNPTLWIHNNPCLHLQLLNVKSTYTYNHQLKIKLCQLFRSIGGTRSLAGNNKKIPSPSRSNVAGKDKQINFLNRKSESGRDKNAGSSPPVNESSKAGWETQIHSPSKSSSTGYKTQQPTQCVNPGRSPNPSPEGQLLSMNSWTSWCNHHAASTITKNILDAMDFYFYF